MDVVVARGSGNADWYFFTCIANNRLGVGSCTGMYIRESAIMDAIKVEIGKYVEDNKQIEQSYERDKCVLEKNLVVAKSSLNIHMDQLQQIFEQNVRGQLSQEEFEQVVAEKRITEQEVLVIENDISQHNEAYEKYRLFYQSNTNVDLHFKIVQNYLCSVSVGNGNQVSVCWNDIN